MSYRDKKDPLGDILRKARRALIYAALFSFFLNFLTVLLPIYSLQVLDRVLSSQSLETLVVLSMITVVAFLFYGVFYAIRNFVLSAIGEWLENKLAPELLRLSLVQCAIGQSLSASQMQRELANVKNFISGGLSTIMDAPWSLLFLAVVFLIHPALGLVGLAGAVIMFLFALANEWASRKPLDEAQENMVQSMQMVDLATRNAEAAEAMGMMEHVLGRWNKFRLQGAEKQNLASKRSQIIQACSRAMRMIIQICIIGVGGYLALQNSLTVGGMIASSILVGRALGPFDAAIGVWKHFIAARDSYHRLNILLSHARDDRGTMELPAPKGDLLVEGLSYRPDGAPEPTVRNINFALAAGESLGVIGPSAAGKSTLSKLIVGVLPPGAGAVRLDGMELYKWSRSDVGQYIGYMPQQIDLFAGTIFDNIARMRPDADAKKVVEAAQMAGCHEMVMRFPNAYETEYLTVARTLSPGQCQRIALARAVYNNPRYVVMDEPNSNLDGEGERALHMALRKMKAAGMTTIIIAHKPSIVGMVDKVMMIRDGAMERFGPREEVLALYTNPAAPKTEGDDPEEGSNNG